VLNVIKQTESDTVANLVGENEAANNLIVEQLRPTAALFQTDVIGVIHRRQNDVT